MTTSPSLQAVRPTSARILTIQSHVVHGYVGNKSATFPLQLLGWEVDALNTVQFSNHLGYGHHRGDKMSVDHLKACIDGLDQNGLLTHAALLTGFTPGPQGVEALHTFINNLRRNNPDVIYLVDPVMGDDGKLYVDSEVPRHYQALLSSATIATPNDFEAELLTGVRPDSVPHLLECLRTFHERYSLPHIIITSVALSASAFDNLTSQRPTPDVQGMILVCAGSSRLAPDLPDVTWALTFPRLDQRFDGVGDLFASLLLARFLTLSGPDRLSRATELAVASVQAILHSTRLSAKEELCRLANTSGLDAGQLRVANASATELKIIQNKHHIEHPEVAWRAFAI